MVESGYVYLRQLGNGPALGFWQMEPATHNDCWNNFLAFRGPLRAAVVNLGKTCQPEEMMWSLRYAAAMCRIKYFRSPKPLPTNSQSSADMWLSVYNAGGKGTTDKFLKAWKQCGIN